VLVPLLSLLVTVATAPAVGPLGVVKAADAEVEHLLATKDVSTQKLAARADQYIDFTELARRALGQDWAGLNKSQQEAFSSTMKGMLRASYAQKALGDGRAGAKVEYGAETVEGNEATVSTTMRIKEDRLPVVYKLYRAGGAGAWKIYDVITDDVSLVTTYNDEFRRVIAKRGFDGLLKSLRARQAQLEHPTDAGKDAR
jgi:phospholipid transport system substrate-binding protein